MGHQRNPLGRDRQETVGGGTRFMLLAHNSHFFLKTNRIYADTESDMFIPTCFFFLSHLRLFSAMVKLWTIETYPDFTFCHLLNILKENREVVKKTPCNFAVIFFLFPPHLWNNSVHLAFVCVKCVMTLTKGKCLSEKTRDRVSDFPTW